MALCEGVNGKVCNHAVLVDGMICRSCEEERARPVTLTREQAREQGYTGYAEHLLHLPCPRVADPRVYCATCQGALSHLRKADGARLVDEHAHDLRKLADSDAA